KPEPQESGPRIIIPEKINMKEVYPLVYSPTEQNFVFAGCCSPVPGDDVMGFVNDNGEVEVHSLTCPHAQLLKAGYGPRILSTRWETVERTFPAEVNIDGVDRHGILQELTQLISTQLGIDIRALHIDTDHEVFNCRLKVMVADAGVIVELCDKIKKIDGVQSAMRVEIAGE
ncbi:MAG: GTP pyrophosphokinase, partial [Paramuribaculum sp.]|nr:GTP pyrophosphokinase [Paramuribaculum sp.]